MVNIEDKILEKIKDILKRYENKEKININEIIKALSKLRIIESRDGPISIDEETRGKFNSLVERELEKYANWLLNSRSKISEKQFNLYIEGLYPFSDLLSYSLKEKVDQIVLSNKEKNKSFLSQPPTDYKFWLIMWTGTVIFLSFLSFCIIKLIVNRIKKNSKKQ